MTDKAWYGVFDFDVDNLDVTRETVAKAEAKAREEAYFDSLGICPGGLGVDGYD